MSSLPRKKAVALDLLERTSVFVHLDPRRPGVIVPKNFLKQPQLVLQIGLNMALAIPDLDVNDEGISCTLSFSRRPHFCSLPWSAIYALIGEQGGGMVWPEDVPPEVVAQQHSAAKKAAERQRKPGLRAVSGESADRKEEGPSRSRTPNPEPARQEGGRPASTPPRLVQVVSNPQPEPALAEAEGEAPDSDTRSDEVSAPPAASKRPRPPYLRLVQ